MTCDELRAFLDASLPGERSAEQMEEVRRHAMGCQACGVYLSELLRVEGELNNLPAIEPSAALVANVMQRVRRGSPKQATSTIGEMAWWTAMLLGLSVSLVASLWPLRPASWLRGLWEIDVGADASNPVKELLQQPLPVVAVAAVGLTLFVVALLWREVEGSLP